MDSILDNTPANTREYIMMKRAEDASSTVATAPKTLPPFDTSDQALRLHVIASGSKGNCSLIETRDHMIMVDCGITKTQFLSGCETLGLNPQRIDAVFITHEHTDHTKGLGVTLRALSKLECLPRVFMTVGTYEHSSEIAKNVNRSNLVLIDHGQDLSIGDITVQVFPTSHDAADPIGFGFEAVHDGMLDRIGYVTDTGYLPNHSLGILSDVRILALESNHDPHLLKVGPYPAALKRRVASDVGHLSNEQSSEALGSLLSNRLIHIVGMHLSETNNLPRIARASLEAAVSDNGHDATVHTAYQAISLSVG